MSEGMKAAAKVVFRSPEEIAQANRVIELRTRGVSFREIAKALNISRPTAQRRFHKGMMLLAQDTQEKAEIYRRLEEARLDDIYRRAIEASEQATSLYGKDSEEHADYDARVKALEVARKVSLERRKLLGLDPATRVSGPDGGPIPISVTSETEQIPDDQLDDRLASFFAGVSAGEARERLRAIDATAREVPKPELPKAEPVPAAVEEPAPATADQDSEDPPVRGSSPFG